MISLSQISTVSLFRTPHWAPTLDTVGMAKVCNNRNDWRSIFFQTTDRVGNVKTERTWMNYGEPTRLHEYRFLDDYYRDQQREWIKRGRARWMRMLIAGVPAGGDQNAISAKPGS